MFNKPIVFHLTGSITSKDGGCIMKIKLSKGAVVPVLALVRDPMPEQLEKIRTILGFAP